MHSITGMEHSIRTQYNRLLLREIGVACTKFLLMYINVWTAALGFAAFQYFPLFPVLFSVPPGACIQADQHGVNYAPPKWSLAPSQLVFRQLYRIGTYLLMIFHYIFISRPILTYVLGVLWPDLDLNVQNEVDFWGQIGQEFWSNWCEIGQIGQDPMRSRVTRLLPQCDCNSLFGFLLRFYSVLVQSWNRKDMAVGLSCSGLRITELDQSDIH